MIIEYPGPEAYAGVKYSPRFLAEVLDGVELREWAARDRTFITAPRKVREVFFACGSHGFSGDIEIVYYPSDQQFTVTKR